MDPAFRQLLENPDHYLPDPGRLPPGQRPSTNVACVAGYFLKRYNRTSPKKMLKSLFRTAPAQNAFAMASALEGAGILTPRVLAVGNKRVARLLLRSYLVTENVADATTVDRYSGDTLGLARKAAAFIARLHDAGFLHRDLNPTNLLLDSLDRLLIVDLDTMRHLPVVPPHLALEDLARFSRRALCFSRISLTQRARFLQEYCRLRGWPDWRVSWNRIEQLNRTEYDRLERHSRRGPIARLLRF